MLLAVSIITISLLNAQPWTNVGGGLTESVKKLITYNNTLFAITSNTNIWDGVNWTTYSDTLNIIDLAIKNDTLFALSNEDIYYWTGNSWAFYFYNYMSDYYQTHGYPGPVLGNLFVYNNEFYLFYDMPMKFYKVEGDSLNLIGETTGPIDDIEDYNNMMCLAGCFASINDVHSPHFIEYDDNGNYYQAENGFIIQCEAHSITKYNNLIYIGGYNLYELDSAGTNLFTWDGTNIHPVTESPNNTVSIVETIGDKLFISGEFTEIGNNQINYLGYFDGINWINKGVNFSDSLHRIKSIVEYDGKVFIGGSFNINNLNDTIKNIATFDLSSEVEALNYFSESVKVFPNPFSNYTIFTIPNYNVNNNYTLVIYSLSGVKIKEVNNILLDKYKLINNDLEIGYYLYKVIDNKTGINYNGKIIVK